MNNPYILCVAYPDYKRPFVANTYGIGIVNTIPILRDIFYDVADGYKTYKHFAGDFYSDCYMDQPPIQLMEFDLETKIWRDRRDYIETVFIMIKDEAARDLEAAEEFDDEEEE